MEVVKTLDEMIERAKSSTRWTLSNTDRLSAEDFSAKFELYDLVEGNYILRPIIQISRGTTRVRALLDASNVLPVEVFGGDASVERDALNGNILIRPRGDQTVHARPSINVTLAGQPIKLTGPDIEVGIDAKILGPGENATAVMGGGACASVVYLASSTDRIDVNVQVRAAATATAMPKTLTRREVEWRNGRYFAYNPAIGFMSLSYDPDRPSKSVIETNNANFSTTRSDFFPARTQNSIYFLCDLVDIGISTFSKVPMRQTLAAATWPPFSTTPINIDEPVEFFDVRDPDRLVMRLESQNLHLYDYNSIDIELVSQQFNGDIMTSTWEIRNQADSMIFARWFLLGDFERQLERPYEGNRLLGPSGSPSAVARVDVAVKVTPSVLPQSIFMSAVSLRDPILAGQTALPFRYPG